VIALGMIVLSLEATANGLEYPQNVGPIELKDVRWQFLPQTVRAVFVDPNGRIWYQLHHPSEEENLPIVRQIIEGQFLETSPQFSGVEPALFESNGRVWFRTQTLRTLLGYDGRDWIERPAGSGQRFFGSCPRNGRIFRCDYNLEVDRVLFFPDERGVHMFSGEQWGYQAMGPIEHYVRIVVRAEPGNRGVIAINPGNLSKVWYCRRGQWHEEDLTEPGIQDVLPSQGNGVWLLTNDGGLQFHSFGADDKDLPKLPVRDASDVSSPPTFHLLHCDSPTGRCFFVMERPRYEGAPPQRDLLILNDGVEPVVIPGYEGPMEWDTILGEDSGPIFTPDGRGVWIPGRYDTRGCDMLDLTTGTLMDRIPDPAFFWIHAVHPDGTVFVSTREPGQLTFALAAYRPAAPMAANMLGAWTYMLQSYPRYPAVCVDSTGDAWAALEDKGLCRFDGTQWQAAEDIPPEYGRVHLLLPGTAGRIIVGTDGGYYYRKDGAATKHDSLRDVIAQNLDDIIASYQTATPGDRCYNTFVSVVADGAGNVWLLDSRKLSVFMDGQWLDAESALIPGGSRTGKVEYVNTVAGRGAVYLSDFKLPYEHGRSFCAHVDDAQVIVSDAPHCTDWTRMQLSVRDPEGTLWIPGHYSSGLGPTCDLIDGRLVPRGGEQGVIQPFSSLGWPMLCDAAGIVWTGQIQGEPATKLNLWRERSLLGQVEIPFEPRWLFSDREGSVYIWTYGGLYRLTASGPGLTDYAVSEYYLTPTTFGDVVQFAYSEKGFVVLRTESYFPSYSSPRVFRLLIVPIPVLK
jgi:hypothetical protein